MNPCDFAYDMVQAIRVALCGRISKYARQDSNLRPLLRNSSEISARSTLQPVTSAKLREVPRENRNSAPWEHTPVNRFRRADQFNGQLGYDGKIVCDRSH